MRLVTASPLFIAALGLVASVVSVAACSKDASPVCVADTGQGPTQFTATIAAVDESGASVASATIDLGDHQVASTGGSATLANLTGPVLAVVSAPGFLAEPVPVGWGDAGHTVKVRLLSDKGGERIVMHSAGDVMFGRRFEAPTDPTKALVPQNDAANGARQVVAAIRRAYAAADVKTLNFETVMSDRPDTSAYPGKRFILRTRPAAVTGLTSLTPTMVGQANNHSRDYGDDGISDTSAALQAAGVPFIGSTKDGEPETPFTTTVRGTRVGILAWTTVDGSYVNDNYPPDGETEPQGVAPKDQYEYDARHWSFTGQAFSVPDAPRRIGGAWSLFKSAEGKLSDADDVGAWTSLQTVYPEMQDWVARRGHGGAQPWDQTLSVQAITALRQQSDIVVVNLHAGFQFQEAAGANVKTIARSAIDAGADLVVCHHPHVLQGLEFYRGKLIAYSLGNFVFDQDFLSTFASAILRTVWEKETMIEARLIPVEIQSYRPMAVTDGAARNALARMWERSLLRAAADRDPGGAVHPFPDEGTSDVQPAMLALEHNTARVVADAPAQASSSIPIAPGAIVKLGFDGLVDPRLGLAGASDAVDVGRDVLQYGRFEDETADESVRGDLHWNVSDDCDKNTTTGVGATGRGFLRMLRRSSSSQQILTRSVARIPLFHYRLYDTIANGEKPLDPTPSYTVHFSGRIVGSGTPSIRVDAYHFDDTDPTEDPDSTLVATLELPVSIPADGAWHEVDVAIDPKVLGDANSTANMALLYARLNPSPGSSTTFDVDDLAFVEWRRAPQMTDRFGSYQFARNVGTAPATVNVVGLPFTR